MEVDVRSKADSAPPIGQGRVSKPNRRGKQRNAKALGEGTGGGPKGPPGAPLTRIALEAPKGGKDEGGSRIDGGAKGRTEGGAEANPGGGAGAKPQGGAEAAPEGGVGTRPGGERGPVPRGLR